MEQFDCVMPFVKLVEDLLKTKEGLQCRSLFVRLLDHGHSARQVAPYFKIWLGLAERDVSRGERKEWLGSKHPTTRCACMILAARMRDSDARGNPTLVHCELRAASCKVDPV
ncbi:hypothetical protein CLAIMM_11536 isoform 2 [Cladophialophora immunda]|nr:hypothetical protein CLAIMM_11536 isoform 1 [Cladophialophora immunda]OQV07045.1 hypothetical protein CLAIMM_11536 isoform 2 [Cladophialophora immunda]